MRDAEVTHMLRKEIVRDLITSLALIPLPFALLALKLVQSGTWEDARKALQGNYTVHGVSSNPWRDFLPPIVLAVLSSLLLAWAATIITKRLSPHPQRLTVDVFMNLLAAITFGLAMAFASIAPLWFAEELVMVSFASSPFFWMSAVAALAFLLVKSYWLLRQDLPL
jgi:hypothetical protein